MYSEIVAQDTSENDTTYWKNSFKIGLNLNQTSFSDSWTGGGVNSQALGSFLNAKARYKKGKIGFANELDMIYGVNNVEGLGIRKTVDQIFLDSKVNYMFSDKWKGSTSLNFISQFADGYEYNEDNERGELISSFMAPGFITLAFGMMYEPNDFFNVRLSPFAPRITIVADDSLSENFGVEAGENVRYEWLSAQIIAEFDKDLRENLNFKWKYLLFANYEELDIQKIDHRLDISITAKITNYINTFVSGIFVYDYDQSLSLQSSQQLAIGLIYKVANFKEEE